MSTESSSSVTWQKLAVIIAILTLALPVFARFAFRVVFPDNYLLYETTSVIKTERSQVGAVIVINGGTAAQKEVALYLPSGAADAKSTFVEISAPRRSSLRSLFEADPSTPLSKFSQGTGFKIPLGTIEKDEEVRVTLKTIQPGDLPTSSLLLSEVRAESAAMTAIEADGLRRPEFHEDWHTFYMDVSPYLLALVLAVICLGVLVSFIHDVFFDTPRKKMARLWRQMDQLQEQIDKDRRYE
ncbi:P-loop NTPase family protein [Solilutibacter oculi]|uniref:hypothetical protein n=1 Tax=Solilutibacter oculi TaxID=2698682 RepID=UPI0013A65647|nr:hypothetical protein [Lysobacter oculi]